MGFLGGNTVNGNVDPDPLASARQRYCRNQDTRKIEVNLFLFVSSRLKTLYVGDDFCDASPTSRFGPPWAPAPCKNEAVCQNHRWNWNWLPRVMASGTSRFIGPKSSPSLLSCQSHYLFATGISHARFNYRRTRAGRRVPESCHIYITSIRPDPTTSSP